MSLDLPIYCLVGDRPVKAVATPEGGMDVLAFDWKTGEFVRDMSYTHTVVHPLDEDVDFVDEKTFEAHVEAEREKLGLSSSPSTVILLRHHDRFDRLLAYWPASGEYREIMRSARPKGSRLWTGYYLTLSGEAFGVYATARGPVFFHNTERHLLPEGETKAEHEAGVKAGVNRFRLTVGGQEIASFEYSAPPAGVSPYDDDEMTDFFAWLAKCIQTGGLFAAYGVDGEAALWDEPEPPQSPSA